MGDFAQHSIKGSCLTALTQIFANAKTSFMLGTSDCVKTIMQ